jgi:hypothetical protein
MNLLAVLLLAAAPASARVEAVNLATVDSRLAVRVALSGQPGMVAVHREGEAARVSITETTLGTRFAGGSRFAWTPDPDFDLETLSGPTRLDRLEVMVVDSEVSILLHVPPEVSIDIRRDRRGLLLVFREDTATAPPPTMAQAPPPAPAPVTPPPEVATSAEAAEPPPVAPPPVAAEPEEAPPPTPAPPEPTEPATATAAATPGAEMPAPITEPVSPPPAADAVTRPAAPPEPTSDTVELVRGLFPPTAATTMAASQEPTAGAPVGELYAQLFPDGAPQTTAETVEPTVELAEAQGVPFGPFRVQGSVDARYIDADTFVEATGQPVRDRYLEVVPRLVANAPVSEGSFSVEYLPIIRAFATFPQINRNSHRVTVGLDVPVGPSVVLRARNAFLTGTLESRDVDPGGEYFFGLGEFRRNNLTGGMSILVGPRASLELDAGTLAVRFQEPSTFFDYDTRFASAGLGYELSPNLRAIFGYQYDTLPTPTERPEAEARAHNAKVTLSGDVLPLLSGEIFFGYRDQKTPNAGEGGTRYQGFIMGGALTKQFSRKSDVTVFVNRTTPASAFESNAFYVYTALQGSARFPLPLELQALGGLGYQWNDYRVASAELGVPREDRILAWYVGLRRPIHRKLFLSATYRRQERRSNLDAFDVDADGFLLQLEWDIFGNNP